MTALDLLQALRALGVIMTPLPDGIVHCRAPKGVLTPTLLDAMRRHKAALLALLAQPAPANDATATEPSTPEPCTHKAHMPLPPPPYPGRPVGAPFRPGHQVWLYRWDDQTPRCDAPVTIVQMRTLWPGEQDIGWCHAVGELTWHHTRLAVAAEPQEAEAIARTERRVPDMTEG